MTMPDLSPAAQAVLDGAGNSEPGIYATVIATLESVADQVVPEAPEPPEQLVPDCNDPWPRWNARQEIRAEILAIAAELRGQSTSQEVFRNTND